MNKFLLAILSGALLALAWPTYGISLLIFIAFVPLLWIERKVRLSNSKSKKLLVFGYAYTTFLIFNAITTWWLYYATPFGMYFAVLVNSFLMSSVFLAYHFLAEKLQEKHSYWMLICLWIAFEKFHLNWEFSWPWLNLGNVFSESYKWVQWYEYTGTFGGTLWIWVVNILFFRTLLSYNQHFEKKIALKASLLPIAIVVIGIFSSLNMYHNYQEATEKTTVIVLQPNIDPYTEKYNISNKEMAKQLTDLAMTEYDYTVDVIIAPETSLPKSVPLQRFQNTTEYNQLAYIAHEYKTTFLGGISFYKQYSSRQKPNATANFFRNSKNWYNSYNSAFLIDKDKTFEYYHKSKLVVGVEHFPYRNIIRPIIGNYMIDLGGSTSTLTTQEKRSVFKTKNAVIAPIICYESVYGSYVTEYVNMGADLLAVITNDGWWSTSEGHRQHLSLARLRAIETRRSIARAANTGISAFINEKGDILQSIPYGEKGALKATVTKNKKLSYYTQQGDYIYKIALLVMAIVLLTSFTKKKNM